MALTQINSYTQIDTNIQAVQTTLDKTRIGMMSVSLTNKLLSVYTVPAIAAGSWVEVGGALYSADTEQAISTTDPITGVTVDDGLIWFVISSAGAAYMTKTAPTWSDAKQGWYGTGDYAADRYIGGCGKTTISAVAYYCGKGLLNDPTPIGKIIDIVFNANDLMAPYIMFPYILSYGQTVNSTEFNILYDLLGTAVLPDLRGRKTIGLDDMGGTAAGRNTDGAALIPMDGAGSETNTITWTQHYGAEGDVRKEDPIQDSLTANTFSIQDPYMSVYKMIKFI